LAGSLPPSGQVADRIVRFAIITVPFWKSQMSKRRIKTEIVKVFTLKELLAPPDASLTIDQYGDYMRGQLTAIGGHYKKVALHIYYLGEALVLAKEQFKEEKRRDWGEYLDGIGISAATATRARQLYDWAESPESLVDMTITDAYRKFGILQPPKLTDEKSEGEKTASKEEAKGGEVETGKDSVPAKVEAPTLDKSPPKEIEDDDLPEKELDIHEDDVPASKTSMTEDKSGESSDGNADEPVQPAVEKQSQPEIKVALEDVTEAEMDAFTQFVEIAGTLERAKAIFKTCVKARSELYAD